jgi:hypothetical protein
MIETIEIAPKSTEILATWNDARLYCFSLIIDDKTGWRLPTKDELNEIYESENDFEKRWYWSSTEYNGLYAWSQNMNGGIKGYGGDKNYAVAYVRAIRSI